LWSGKGRFCDGGGYPGGADLVGDSNAGTYCGEQLHLLTAVKISRDGGDSICSPPFT
jgi:hypothetical protein